MVKVRKCSWSHCLALSEQFSILKMSWSETQCALNPETFFEGSLLTAKVANNSHSRSTPRRPWSCFNFEMGWNASSYRFSRRCCTLLVKDAWKCGGTEIVFLAFKTGFYKKTCHYFWVICSYCRTNFDLDMKFQRY